MTKAVPYFDFFEARKENSQAVLEMKELYAQNILGNRFQKRCGEVELYIPFLDSLNRQKIDFPVVQTETSFFERGLKFFSEKIGNFIIFFADVTAVTLISAIDNPWAVFQLKENLFFSRLAQPFICLRFSKVAQQTIFLKFQEKLPEVGVKVEYASGFPDFMRNSSSLRALGVLREPAQKASFLENTEIACDEDFIRFNTQIQKFKILQQDDQAVVEDQDVALVIDPQAALQQQSEAPRESEEEAPEEKFRLYFIVGPPFSGKRQFGQAVFDQRSKFPFASRVGSVLVCYEDSELPDLTTEGYKQRILGLVNDPNEEERMSRGDWIFVVVPHTVSHLELLAYFRSDPSFSIEACVAKLNLSDFYTKNQTPILHLRRYLEEGFVSHCFADYEGMESGTFASRLNIVEEAFPHVRFHELYQNKVIWSRLQHTVSQTQADRVRRDMALKYNVASYEFGESVIRLDYRIPILEEQLHRFREVVIDLEGALLQPEQEPDPEPEDPLLKKKKFVRLNAKDLLMESINKLMAVMKGLIAKRDQAAAIPFITRMKGVFRFDGKLEKGPYSLYLSPYGFYFENLGVPTELKSVEKNGQVLQKSVYENFEFNDLGFYIYGKNLDPKAINYWFNKNLLPVTAAEPESRPQEVSQASRAHRRTGEETASRKKRLGPRQRHFLRRLFLQRRHGQRAAEPPAH